MANKTYKKEREKVAELARYLVNEGVIIPVGGQISWRIREDFFIVKATGQSMLMPDDYCVIIRNKVPENVSKMFPVHKFILDRRKEDVILHVRAPYIDIAASFLKGQGLVSPEILWGLRSEIPVESFPNEDINNFEDLVNIFKGLSNKHLIESSKTGFIVEHFGTWLVASDLDKAYAYIKILESTAKITIYKKIIGTDSIIPANLNNFLERTAK